MAVLLRQSLNQITQLIEVIVGVGLGQVIVDPAIAGTILLGKTEPLFLMQLTPKEKEVPNLLAGGYTNSAIAEELYIDIKTVEHHLNSIYSKLKSKTEIHKKHLRVAATRAYLQETGQLSSN